MPVSLLREVCLKLNLKMFFSLSSGRRCATGAGIYAFRCRRAGMLFRTLQINIQLRNVIQDTLNFQQLPSNLVSPTAYPRQMQSSVVRRSSIDNGTPSRLAVPSNNLSNLTMQTGVRNLAQTPRSPSNSDILEVMPLYPRPQNNNNHVTNIYQMKDFQTREPNNNQGEQNSDPRHLYTNDLSRDLAILRNALRQENALSTIRDIEDENNFLQARYMNEVVPSNRNNAPLSPTLSNASEHYAQLSIEQQEAARHYMNILPSEHTADLNRNDAPTTPLTPKQPEYCNFGLGKLEMNSYANIGLGEMVDNATNVKQMLLANPGEKPRKFSESDTFPSMTPTEELEMNYAILDIETKDAKMLSKDTTSRESNSEGKAEGVAARRGRNTSQSSAEPPPAPVNVGYTTIDFEKTVALTSVVAGHMDADAEAESRPNNTNARSSSSNNALHAERNK